MRRILAVGLSILLLTAACGSDDDSADADPSSGAEEQPSEAPTEDPDAVEDDAEADGQDVEADRAAAESALLTLADFPTGWSEVPDTDDDDDEEMDRRQAECLGASGEELFEADAQAETGSFTDPGTIVQVEQVVGLEPSVDAATTRLAGFSGDDVTVCLTEAYNDRFRALIEESVDLGEADLGDITVGALNITPVGDESYAFRVEIPISIGTSAVTAVGDLIAVRVGRSLTGLSFFSENGPNPIERIDEYTALAASRLPG